MVTIGTTRANVCFFLAANIRELVVFATEAPTTTLGNAVEGRSRKVLLFQLKSCEETDKTTT